MLMSKQASSAGGGGGSPTTSQVLQALLFALWGFEYEYCLQELWLYIYSRGLGPTVVWEGTCQHFEEKMLLKSDTGFLSASGGRLFTLLKPLSQHS